MAGYSTALPAARARALTSSRDRKSDGHALGLRRARNPNGWSSTRRMQPWKETPGGEEPSAWLTSLRHAHGRFLRRRGKPKYADLGLGVFDGHPNIAVKSFAPAPPADRRRPTRWRQWHYRPHARPSRAKPSRRRKISSRSAASASGMTPSTFPPAPRLTCWSSSHTAGRG